ncbi:MAG: dTDP-4-dehydrorhamnose reductase [Flavobacteriales bacterium]|nr:dTDP-4-dehydrorhamnose reductase [Flavobacteriales bacterium]
MRIAITGTTGQLGGRLHALSESEVAHGMTLLALGRDRLDLLNPATIPAALDAMGPDVIISCAAYTAVDAAEDDADTAFKVNGEAPGLLGKACADRGIQVVHISTDYVFDGRGQRPYLPSDQTGPTGIYGASKLAGERALLGALPSASIVRVGWLYDREGQNFLNTMLRLAADRDVLSVVDDQLGCPTHVGDFAADLLQWVRLGAENPQATSGVHHYGHSGITSWWGFASEIMRHRAPHVRVDAVQSDAFPTRATRPAYSKLDEADFFARLGRPSISWKVALERCLSAKFDTTNLS